MSLRVIPQPLAMEGPAWSLVLPIADTPLTPALGHAPQELASEVYVHGRDVTSNTFSTIETIGLK